MLTFNRQLIDKYDIAGPRYTSYPPATFFHDKFGREDLIRHIRLSNNQKPENISIYIHIPFCPRLCTFCGCTTYTSMGNGRITEYIQALIKEIELVAKFIDTQRPLTQIHWGGGTPNSIALDHILKVTETIKGHFTLAPHYEMAMECSPAYLTYQMADHLASMGFNRLSLGVQDFNPKVLTAINRKPALENVGEMIAYLRTKGFKGINLDLVYGLPYQTQKSFSDTVSQALEARPDRLVTFSYAHIPGVKPNQKKLESYGLPGAEEKMAMLESAYNLTQQAGYIAIGMDHFALPQDELVQSMMIKKLHRNFQGYCTLTTTGQVYAFGASAITQLYSAYAQNEKTVPGYIQQINRDGLATTRGYELSRQELIVRQVINELMCNYYVDFKAISREFQTHVNDIYDATGFQREKLQSFIDERLVQFEGDILKVEDQGRFIIRNIAMVFDPAFNPGKNNYSRTV